jgi:hypothetical protein
MNISNVLRNINIYNAAFEYGSQGRESSDKSEQMYSATLVYLTKSCPPLFSFEFIFC